jgi:hypothetical protein
MKIEKFQLHCNNSMYAGACQLLRGRSATSLRWNADSYSYLARNSQFSLTLQCTTVTVNEFSAESCIHLGVLYW